MTFFKVSELFYFYFDKFRLVFVPGSLNVSHMEYSLRKKKTDQIHCNFLKFSFILVNALLDNTTQNKQS